MSVPIPLRGDPPSYGERPRSHALVRIAEFHSCSMYVVRAKRSSIASYYPLGWAASRNGTATPMSDSQSTGTQPTSAGRLAYVLDDEPQVRAIAGKILSAIGFEPHQFAAPAALFGELKKASPELIVLDLALGQSDAIEVIRHLETFHYTGKPAESQAADSSMLRGRGGRRMTSIERKP